MKPQTLIVVCACALLVAGASSASAQLVFGTTTSSTSNPAAMYLDINTGQVTTLWNSASHKKVNGMAADPDTGRLYTNDAARLNYWNYGDLSTAPTFIAGMYRTEDFVSFSATGVDGLAFANGRLYGATSYQSTTFSRGIYEVATVPDGASHCVMTPLWLDPTASPGVSGTLSLDGLDFNAGDGLFYATQTEDAGDFTRGLYSIDAFGTGDITKIADFPAGYTDIGGLAIGGGKFWLVQQEPGASRIDIFPYDPATGLYGDTIYVPLADGTQRATGAAWAPGALPEPGTLSALALVALVALRRR
jgi:hypothetical protein